MFKEVESMINGELFKKRKSNNATGLDSLKPARSLRITLAALRLAGEKFRPPAWPLKSAFIKAKLRLFSRIPNVEWPSSIARLRKGDVVRSPYWFS